MHKFATLLAGFTAVVAVTALAAGPALADPPAGVTPRSSDVVGLTPAETAPICDQWSHDYNAQHPRAATKLYCWGPTPPGQITTKAGGAGHCKISRPATSSAGIAALQQNGIVMGGTGFCIDFVLSTRARQATDPACASGGICFVSLMADAVTWADRGAAAGGTNAPATLAAKQLRRIYLCNIRNWSKVGGKAGTIKPFLPQSASGTRQFFLTALGGGTPITPGPCVSDSNNLLMENEGVAPN